MACYELFYHYKLQWSDLYLARTATPVHVQYGCAHGNAGGVGGFKAVIIL